MNRFVLRFGDFFLGFYILTQIFYFSNTFIPKATAAATISCGGFNRAKHQTVFHHRNREQLPV